MVLKVFHIQGIQEGQLIGDKYIMIPSEELEFITSSPIDLGNREATRVRIVTRLDIAGPFLEFNPTAKVDLQHTVWLIGRIEDPQIDLAEWS